MAFTPKAWENAPSTDTPISAEALIDIEERVTDYADSLNTITPATIASATTIAPAATVRSATVTGSTTITSITATFNGHELKLVFSGTAQLVDGSNLKLNGNFTGAADRTITLYCNGTNWYELARSDNGNGPTIGLELGYSEITSSYTQTGVGTSDVTSLTTTVTVATRPIVVSVWGANFSNSNTTSGSSIVRLQEESTSLAANYANTLSGHVQPLNLRRRLSPSSGSHTYKVTLQQLLAGNTTINADSGTSYGPAFIQVTEV